MSLAFHAFISGRVQGVYFRASTEAQARRLGLTGWVRNRRDGRVEVWFGGEASECAELLEWLHHGPPDARVENVEHEPVAFTEHGLFHTLPTE